MSAVCCDQCSPAEKLPVSDDGDGCLVGSLRRLHVASLYVYEVSPRPTYPARIRSAAWESDSSVARRHAAHRQLRGGTHSGPQGRAHAAADRIARGRGRGGGEAASRRPRPRRRTGWEDVPAATLTLVVPTRNEATHVTSFVERIRAAMAPFPIDWRAEIVDDSDDDTSSRLRRLARRGAPVRVIPQDGERSGGIGPRDPGGPGSRRRGRDLCYRRRPPAPP